MYPFDARAACMVVCTLPVSSPLLVVCGTCCIRAAASYTLLQAEYSTAGLHAHAASLSVCAQSVVKSHLDAIPEDRRAVEKGGGNAVQKLHEVEKYIRKNKLKVLFSCRPYV